MFGHGRAWAAAGPWVAAQQLEGDEQQQQQQQQQQHDVTSEAARRLQVFSHDNSFNA